MNEPPSGKAVFDCNVFLQALGNPRGPAGACLQAVWDGRVQLFISQSLLDELTEVAGRPEISRRLRLLPGRVSRLLEEIKRAAVLVDHVPQEFAFDRDPDDAHYVNLAIATGAFLVVSRDGDLPDLMNPQNPDGLAVRERFPSFRVLTPPQFLETLPARES